MQNQTDTEPLKEIAIILARSILRLQQRSLLPKNEKTPESVPKGLEVSAETVLSVHHG